jgi:pSer/pThr/pTyr-binding forkhead associated (FHA) protein
MTRPQSNDDERTKSLALAGDTASSPRAIVLCEDRLTARDLPAQGRLTIGRTKDCDLRIDHRSVSRLHAALVAGENILVEDLGSANGTRVSGRRLAPHRPEPLPSGAIVEIGVATLVVRGGGRFSATMPRSAGVPSAEATGLEGGESTMDRLWRIVALVAGGTISTLLLGETGVGKEVMAEAIHARSPRRSAPFVKLNCAAMPEGLLESELFGYERGAFSGATHAKPGLLESADGGTILLDEVGELPLATQAKLLRVLESREVTRLGALRPNVVDLRFVSLLFRQA